MAATCCSSAASTPTRERVAAIDVALRSGRPLVIAGIVQDERYFRAEVEPLLGRDGISYVGPVGPDERDRLLGGAAALLHLIDFEEPFGLSVVESLAAGTPVIATPRGSLPELVVDGRTGYLVPDLDAAVAAVGRLPQLDRRECRADAETRFTADRMVGDYERLFERLAGTRR